MQGLEELANFILGHGDDVDENREAGDAEQQAQVASGRGQEAPDVVQQRFHLLLNVQGTENCSY